MMICSHELWQYGIGQETDALIRKVFSEHKMRHVDTKLPGIFLKEIHCLLG